ncbi:MAG: PaaI family thioesterase [Acidobacteria bacterium]|nr:PaaI family thioesterase [Acidobacteriota bacterium]
MATPEQFIAEIRRLIEISRTADLAETVELDAAHEAVCAAREALEPHHVDDTRMQVGLRPSHFSDTPRDLDLSTIQPDDFFPYSPEIGALNPISPPFSLRQVNGEIHGTGRFPTAFCGPPESVHGGHVAAILDEVLGCTGVVTGKGGFTGTLTVRYHSTTPLNTDLVVRGWVDRVEGRKMIICGDMHADDRLCATAEGIFIRPVAGMI